MNITRHTDEKNERVCTVCSYAHPSIPGTTPPRCERHGLVLPPKLTPYPIPWDDVDPEDYPLNDE